MFVSNKKNYFFEIRCDLDLSKVEVEVFETKAQMYLHVCNSENLSLSEVEGYEIVMKLEDGKYQLCERGSWFAIEGDLESYIEDFEI